MPGKPLIWVIWIVFVFVGLCSCLSAQPTLQWQNALGGSSADEAKSIDITIDQGYIVAGNTYSSNGNVTGYHGFGDIWIAKMDDTGLVEWSRALGGSDEEGAYAIQEVPNGGYILAGYTASVDGDVATYQGGKDAWIVKLSPSGEIEWQQVMGGSGSDEAWMVVPTNDGGYIMTGRSNSTDGDVTGLHGYSDFWVVKLDGTGSIQWQKTYGGNLNDYGRAIKQTSDGGYILIGDTQSNDGDVTGNHGDIDFWVLKISGSGEMEWQQTLGGCCWDVGTDIIETSNGFLTCGYTASNDGDVTNHHGLFDFWVVSLSDTGEIVWQKTFGGTNSDYPRSLIQTPDGNYIVAGETKSNDGDVSNHTGIQVVWVLKLNQYGDLIWQKTLGGSDGEGCRSIQPTPDNGLIFAGYAWSHDGDVSGVHGQSDFWVVKLAPESVGVKEIPGNNPGELQLTPNPAYETSRIQAVAIETSLQIEVLDVLGRKMQAQILLNGKTMSVSDLPIGLYFVHAVGDSGQRYMGRILKQ